MPWFRLDITNFEEDIENSIVFLHFSAVLTKENLERLTTLISCETVETIGHRSKGQTENKQNAATAVVTNIFSL